MSDERKRAGDQDRGGVGERDDERCIARITVRVERGLQDEDQGGCEEANYDPCWRGLVVASHGNECEWWQRRWRVVVAMVGGIVVNGGAGAGRRDGRKECVCWMDGWKAPNQVGK